MYSALQDTPDSPRLFFVRRPLLKDKGCHCYRTPQGRGYRGRIQNQGSLEKRQIKANSTTPSLWACWPYQREQNQSDLELLL
jgi:hypothetical protein